VAAITTFQSGECRQYAHALRHLECTLTIPNPVIKHDWCLNVQVGRPSDRSAVHGSRGAGEMQVAEALAGVDPCEPGGQQAVYRGLATGSG
jgi:hypothetical protein